MNKENMEKNDLVEAVSIFVVLGFVMKVISAVVITLADYRSVSELGYLVINIFMLYPFTWTVDAALLAVCIYCRIKKKTTGRSAKIVLSIAAFQILLGFYVWINSAAIVF